MSERDPRHDPLPEDIVDWGEGPQRVVYIHPDGSVWLEDQDVMSVGLHDLEFYRKWASGAVVLKRAEDGAAQPTE